MMRCRRLNAGRMDSGVLQREGVDGSACWLGWAPTSKGVEQRMGREGIVADGDQDEIRMGLG